MIMYFFEKLVVISAFKVPFFISIPEYEKDSDAELSR